MAAKPEKAIFFRYWKIDRAALIAACGHWEWNARIPAKLPQRIFRNRQGSGRRLAKRLILLRKYWSG